MTRRGLVSKEITPKGPAVKGPDPKGQSVKPSKPAKPVLGGAGAETRAGLTSKSAAEPPPDPKKKFEVPPPPEDLIPLRLAAQRLRVPLDEIKSWLRSGLLRGTLAGVRLAELQNFCRKHRLDLLPRLENPIHKQSAVRELPLSTGWLRAPLWLRRPVPALRRLGVLVFKPVGLWGRTLWQRWAQALQEYQRASEELAESAPPEVVSIELLPEEAPDAAQVKQAVLSRDLARLRKLLEEHAEAVLSSVDEELNSVLHWAVVAGGYERTFLLLTAGAPVNARNRAGCTPLTVVQEARPGGWRLVASLLKERGGVE